jgi:hypothetical protein
MRISCAGVSLGSFFGVLTYLSLQLGQISKPSLTECAISGVKAALDQATHNFLMYQGVFSSQQDSSSIWSRTFQGIDDQKNLIVAAVPHFHQRTTKPFEQGNYWNLFSNKNKNSDSTKDHHHEFVEWDSNSDCVFHGNFAKLKINSQNKKVVVASGKNNDNEYAIVHQYTSDRHPKVMSAAREKYEL